VENDLISFTHLDLGDEFIQTSNSWGDTDLNGFASSFSDTELSILFTNSLDTPLTFELLFSYFVSADIEGDGLDAGSYGEINIFDSGSNLLFASAETFLGGDTSSASYMDSSLIFTVQGNSSYKIEGTVYSDGYAVPEPSMFWLIGLGAIGFMTFRNKKLAITAP